MGFSAAREKLLDTASALFYAQGIVATGVDTVVAAAGVAKPTLYAHFRSKSDLLAAVLERRHERRVATLPGWLADAADEPVDRLLAIFDWLAEWYAREASRGCAFLNAAAETPDAAQPARDVIRRQKRWMAGLLADLAADAGLADPDQLGAQFLLLIDGASSRILVEADSGPPTALIATTVAQARRAAEILVAHARRSDPAPA